MEITDQHGLAIAEIAVDELAGAPWRHSNRHIDVVRVLEPPAAYWDELAASGFIHKPELLSWMAELGGDEEEFLSRLDTKARQDIRRARHRATAALRLVVHEEFEPDLLDRFLALYRERVEAMAYGIPIACRFRDRILDGRPDRYFGVFAMDGHEIAGGCLARECPAEGNTVRLRFSAVTQRWRAASLARTLYFAAMRVARDKGFKWMTLGDEPNLYGHLTKAGLFPFKVAMGFRAVASQDNFDDEGRDIADLVLPGARLSGPGLMLGYAPGRHRDRALTAHLISDTALSTGRFAAPFLAGVELRRPGEPAR